MSEAFTQWDAADHLCIPGFRRTVGPRHEDASHLGASMDVAPCPPALAAKGLESVALDVHRHRVAAVVIRAAERQQQQVSISKGASIGSSILGRAVWTARALV